MTIRALLLIPIGVSIIAAGHVVPVAVGVPLIVLGTLVAYAGIRTTRLFGT